MCVMGCNYLGGNGCMDAGDFKHKTPKVEGVWGFSGRILCAMAKEGKEVTDLPHS